jgi:hypothetical protein
MQAKLDLQGIHKMSEIFPRLPKRSISVPNSKQEHRKPTCKMTPPSDQQAGYERPTRDSKPTEKTNPLDATYSALILSGL